MADFPGEPLDYDFGLDFNYSLWTKDTTIDLVNVPWNNDYRDIVQFDTGELDDYIDSLETANSKIDKLSYVKPNQPIRINVPINKALKYNYLRATNPLQPVTQGDVLKKFYYFITDARYIAPNTTEIVVQLDVWQTFGYDITFGSCYVERGHVGIANTHAFDNYGRDWLTIPEGLDVGGEYTIIATANQQIMGIDKINDSQVGADYKIMIVSTVDLTAAFGDVDAPLLHTATGSQVQGLPSGPNVYTMIPGGLPVLLSFLSDKPWISQGIISIQAVPVPANYGLTQHFDFVNDSGQQLQIIDRNGKERTVTGIDNWRDDAAITEYIPVRYRSLMKFFTFPYMAIELTMFNGKPIILKPESWADDSATVNLRLLLTPAHAKLIATPYKYNARAGVTDETWTDEHGVVHHGDDGGEYFDLSTQMDDFPSFSIVNNAGVAYLAANRNQIAYGYQSADWAQQRALRGNEVSYDQASSGMKLANELTQIGIGGDLAQTNLINNFGVGRAIAGIGGSLTGGGTSGAIAGGMAGGPPGAAIGAAAGLAGGINNAVAGAAGAVLDNLQNTQSQAIRAAQANKSNRAAQGNSGFIRDTNKNLADFAARGDYENTVAGLNAKVQDAKLLQPTISGQVGGDGFNMVYGAAKLYWRYKMIDLSAIASIGEYWLRYGYPVRRFTQLTTLKVMSKFSYWKLTETYINAGAMPESIKQAIRGIFEKGVTVWVDPTYIGNTDFATNTPLGGITI